MKRVLFLLICLIGVASICAKCEGEEPYYEGRWYLKNHTDQILILKYPSFYGYLYSSYYWDIAPGDSLSFNYSYFMVKNNIMPYFNRWVEYDANKFGEDLSLKVFSEDSTLLREWLYLDASQPGKQFFNESSWHHYDIFIERDERIITDIWTFTILSEDITQE